MAESVLFPQPRDLRVHPGRTRLDGATVWIEPDAAPLERQAATLIADTLGTALGHAGPLREGLPDGTAVPAIQVGAVAGAMSLPPDPQGYALVIDESGIRLRGSTPVGTWYAAQTLRQLLAQEGSEVQAGRITDRHERALLYHKAQALINQDAPIILLFFPTQVIGLRTNVEDFHNLGDQRIPLYSVWLTR